MKNCSIFTSTYVVNLHITEFPSSGYIINQIMVCVVICLLVFPTVILNSLSILTISKCPQLEGKVCYYLILVQSVVDLTVGVITAPVFTAFIIVFYILGNVNCVLYMLNYTLAYLPMGLSLVTLCALSFERYMGVLHPMIHRTKVTKKKLSSVVFCATFLIVFLLPGTFIASAYVFDWTCISFVFICITFITFAYTRIFIAARNSLRSKNKPGDCANEQNSDKLSRKRRFLKELKLARSCFLVVCTFGLCFLPVILLSSPLAAVLQGGEGYLARIVWLWTIPAGVLNASLNSIIFFWSRPMLRIEAKKVLKKIRSS